MGLRRLQVELVNQCNLRCPLCRTLKRDHVPRRRMSRGELRRVVEPVAEQVEAVTLHGTRGEPLLHSELETCVADLKRYTGARVDLSTNATLLTPPRGRALLEAGLDQLVIAVDGVTPETYRRYRIGGRLETVVENVTALCQAKAAGGFRTRIVLQLIPMSINEHEIPQLGILAGRLGVDAVRLRVSATVAAHPHYRPRQPAFTGRPASRTRFSCPSGLDRLYVDPNGDVYPCWVGEGVPEMRIGNALETPIDVLYDEALPRRIRGSFAFEENHHPVCVARCATRPASTKLRLPVVGT